MRMGTESPALAELLFTELIDIFAEDPTVDLDMLKEDMDTVGSGWEDWANRHRYERELDEKYGSWKPFFLHPTVQRAMGVWRGLSADFRPIGEPHLSPTASCVLLFMMYRNKQPLHVVAVAAACFFNVHPALILAAIGCVLYFLTGKRLPRGYRAKTAKIQTPPKVQPEEENDLQMKDPYSPEKIPDNIDHIIIGSDFGGLYAGALLSRLGRRVLVLEAGATLCQGRFHTEVAPNQRDGGEVRWAADGPAARTGDPERFLRLMVAACGAGAGAGAGEEGEEGAAAAAAGGCPGLVPVGSEEDGFCHALVAVGEGGLPVPQRAGAAAMVEELCLLFPEDRAAVAAFHQHLAQLAPHARAFFLARALPRKTAEQAKAMVGGQFAAYAASTVQGILGQMRVGAALFSTLAAAFRVERLSMDKAAFGAFVQCWGADAGHRRGQWAVEGGARAAAAALRDAVRARGGAVLTEAPVAGVLVAGGRAVGVRLAPPGGRPGAAGDASLRVAEGGSVISCVGALRTYKELLDKESLPDGPPKSIETLTEAEPMVHVFVGLRGSAADLGLPAADFWQLPNPDLEPESQEHVHIAFPCASDPAWPRRFPGRSVAVVTLPAPDAARRNEETGLYEVLRDEGLLERALGRLGDRGLALLRRHFPEVQGQDEFLKVSRPFRPGLSHTTARYQCDDLRAYTCIPGLFLGGADLVGGGNLSLEGAVQGGWLAAHAATGHTFSDLFLRRRSLPEDLRAAQQ